LHFHATGLPVGLLSDVLTITPIWTLLPLMPFLLPVYITLFCNELQNQGAWAQGENPQLPSFELPGQPL
jgi:hypothetical protein